MVAEKNAYGQSSVGVGGHMNNVVGADSINEVLRVNAQRELNEEVGLSEDDLKIWNILVLLMTILMRR